uniref:Trafficking kinesin-binding protein 1 n=1 Tax=Aceria tosichella TaxID=561515 RepID=A0A6G1SF03_9ACAR
MVELSTSQAISSTITNELNTTNIIELAEIIQLDKTNIEQQTEPVAATVAPAQVDCYSAPKFDQLRVAVVSTNHASTTTSAFQPAPKTTTTLTSSASRERSDIQLEHIEPANKINLCILSEKKQQPNQEQTSASARCDISSPQPSTSTPEYQLRALKGDKSSIEEDNLWSKNFKVPSLSNDLIDETLNYFVNCRHRLSQITKTFDDSDAYILLLQEKEMDLELVARIGQDLLKQFNEVKDSNEALKDELAKFQELNERLKDELAKCREDNQQLRYELSSKVSLLDTFMEEEEEHLHYRDAAATSTTSPAGAAHNRSDPNDEEFFSLRSQSDRATSSNENTLYKRLCELQDELLTKDEILFKQNVIHQERNIHLEVQLRESERRLSGLEAENETLRENQRELYEELKTYSRNFAELLRIFSESQRNSRAHDVGNISFDSFSEAPTSFNPNLNSTAFIQNEHYDTQQYHQTCYNQIGQPHMRDTRGGMVMSSSLHEELQESLLKSGELPVSDIDTDLVTEEHNEAEDESDGSDRMACKISPTTSPSRHHRSHYKQARQQPNYYHDRQNTVIRRHNHDSDSGGLSDGADSGMHTTNISSSTTPINNGLNQDTDSDLDANTIGATPSEGGNNKKNWLGLSTFTLTTLLLICLSATLNTTTNSSLAQKLQQIKFDR